MKHYVWPINWPVPIAFQHENIWKRPKKATIQSFFTRYTHGFSNAISVNVAHRTFLNVSIDLQWHSTNCPFNWNNLSCILQRNSVKSISIIIRNCTAVDWFPSIFARIVFARWAASSHFYSGNCTTNAWMLNSWRQFNLSKVNRNTK